MAYGTRILVHAIPYKEFARRRKLPNVTKAELLDALSNIADEMYQVAYDDPRHTLSMGQKGWLDRADAIVLALKKLAK